ncbi:MAG: acetyl-CoA carboxylase biotin carboxyl carrier protein subunit [Myxococcales bacterium]|nr:acetyl-CoA carboxylase biotin carboxyl carrier protein subunit [Myxococcales bacterium]
MAKMTFIGVADSQEHRVVVDDHDRDDGIYSVELDGKNYLVDAQTMPSEIVTALIDNKSYDLEVDDQDQSSDPLDGRLTIRVRGRIVRLEMLEERRKKMKDAQSSQFSHAGLAQIQSPMPGKVLRYLVSEGDEVKEGQGIVVIEAMKMENELQSPKEGLVKSISSSEGATVSSGALLMVIE